MMCNILSVEVKSNHLLCKFTQWLDDTHSSINTKNLDFLDFRIHLDKNYSGHIDPSHNDCDKHPTCCKNVP